MPVAQRAIEGAGLPSLYGYTRGKHNMILDAIDNARGYLSREAVLAVINWIFEKNVQALHYDPVADQWLMSDGEVYTTNLILREAVG